MCLEGNTCNLCYKKAEVEIFWPSWAGRYCENHGILMVGQAKIKPILILYLEDPCSTN